MGGLAIVSEGSANTNQALTSEYRTADWMGPAQYLDTRCLTVGKTYTVSAQVKVVENGVNFNCDPPSSTTSQCPRLTIKLEDGTWQDENEHWQNIGDVSSAWSSEEWNMIEGTLTVSQAIADAGSVLVYSEGPPPGAMMILDNVSITLNR
uniref:CBM-cenC domain-containing protein n=1 Tax=Grammatophora oceanica TaxID=210454 RepID=A0A7S1V714_9STRA